MGGTAARTRPRPARAKRRTFEPPDQPRPAGPTAVRHRVRLSAIRCMNAHTSTAYQMYPPERTRIPKWAVLASDNQADNAPAPRDPLPR